MRYTKEKLAKIAKESFSIAQVIRKLGLKQAGGTHSHISRKLKEYGINTSHFLGQAANCGRNHKGGKKLHWKEVLVLRHEGPRQKAVVLRRALIEYGRKYECTECGLREWRGALLILEVDHKNHNWLDDRPENIKFICPNCHGQNHGCKELEDITSVARWNREYRKKKARMVERQTRRV